MRTFIENYLHFVKKNCIRPPYKKLKSLKQGFIETRILKIIETPVPHLDIFRCASISWFQVVSQWVSQWGMFFGFPVSQVILVISVSQVIAVSPVSPLSPLSPVRLAHLWVDFRVIFHDSKIILLDYGLFWPLDWKKVTQPSLSDKKGPLLVTKTKSILLFV